MFETGRSRLTKEKVSKVFRFFRGTGKEHFNTSTRTDVEMDSRQSNSPNMQTYIIANQRKLEIESQNAFVTSISRHDRWKAGGPL